MDHQSFKGTCRSQIVDLFDAVEETKGKVAVDLCFRHMVDIPDAPVDSATLSKLDFYLLPRCLHNPTNWSALIRLLETQLTSTESRLIIMMKLYGYMQCIEVRYIYKVIGHLLGHLGGGIVSGDLYDNWLSARTCFDDIRKRCEQVARSHGRRFLLVDTWSCFLDFDLRNAIGHSDFVILADSQTVLLPSYALDAMTRAGRGGPRRSAYTFSEVDNLYARASDFNEAFKQAMESFGMSLGPRY
jgi:hypothetical protein